MKKQTLVLVLVAVLVLGGVVLLLNAKREFKQVIKNTLTAQLEQYQVKTTDLELTKPLANASIGSPLYIEGRVRGPWFFEASFPGKVLDSDLTVLGQGVMKANGNWQTADFANFSGSIIFSHPKGNSGTLVLHNDNPSGQSELDKEVRVPVVFQDASSMGKPSSVCSPGTSCNLDQPGTKICLEDNRQIACN